MTADLATQGNDPETKETLMRLTWTAAGLTLFFAVLSMIVSNRLETLQRDHQTAIHQNAIAETNAIQKIQTDLSTLAKELHTTQEALKAEKATSEEFKKEVDRLVQEAENRTADLALARQTIAELRSAVAAPPAPPTAPDPMPNTSSPEPDQTEIESTPESMNPVPDLPDPAPPVIDSVPPVTSSPPPAATPETPEAAVSGNKTQTPGDRQTP